MSRRSHYARVQHASGRARVEPARPDQSRPNPTTRQAPAQAATAAPEVPPRNGHFAEAPVPVAQPAPAVPPQPSNGHATADVPAPASPRAAATNGHATPVESPGCTAPQLRRFIKSRTYVPMHELRRRFGINGTEDEVTPLDLVGRQIFVGLPSREGGLLGELLRGGDVGYELSLDPRTPVVVGVYPMRPVPRP